MMGKRRRIGREELGVNGKKRKIWIRKKEMAETKERNDLEENVTHVGRKREKEGDENFQNNC